MDRLKGSKIKKIHIYTYTYTHTHHAKTASQKKKEREVHFTFFSLYSFKLNEVPSCHLNEKKAVMPWHDIWQIKDETSLTSIIF